MAAASDRGNTVLKEQAVKERSYVIWDTFSKSSCALNSKIVDTGDQHVYVYSTKKNNCYGVTNLYRAQPPPEELDPGELMYHL